MLSEVNLAAVVPTPSIDGPTVRLEPLTVAVLDAYCRMVDDEEGRRLTGTHTVFDRQQVDAWLRSRSNAPARADWAITAADDGRFLGEAVLFDIDAGNRSGAFRISLAASNEYGRGYGSAATRMVIDFSLRTVGLHRLSLEVYAFNERAIAVYSKCGFAEEGRLRDALLWDGTWHDAIIMAVIADDPDPARDV